tara:strand:+ start:275 stop:730 length:456 start_codon:yes stop_codon:yes gene_type:complete
MNHISKKEKIKDVFIDGAITSEFISKSVKAHQSKTNIGAHNIFLGQVRADNKNGKIVKAIEYEAYKDMANKKFHDIKESTFEKFNITCMHIYHSLGYVNAGEISLFVFVSSARRDIVFKSLNFVVEEIKKEVPIFGKEFFSNESYKWKQNV